MYWDHMNGWGWMMMVFWSLIWIGLLGVIAWVAVQWARGGSRDSASGQAPSSKTAQELLDERLARGDIDPDDYQRRREALEQHQRVGV